MLSIINQRMCHLFFAKNGNTRGIDKFNKYFNKTWNYSQRKFIDSKNSCVNCKFKKQGATCSVCSHPKQDESLKKYIYPPYFICDLFKKIRLKTT